MARKHKMDEVLRKLSRKNDCKVFPYHHIVEVLGIEARGKSNDLGNGSWGLIDYLINHSGYRLLWVNKFTERE